MHREKAHRQGNGGDRKGALFIVGLGPGSVEHLTPKAKQAIESSDCVVGYTGYIALVQGLIKGKEVFSTNMTHEMERCKKAIELASSGKRVSLVSSGDSGIYGMAGLALELALRRFPVLESGAGCFDIEVIAGVPAFVCAAAMLGAPLMLDFASISLSDLLTPWENIEKKLEGACIADFVLIFYNPKSSRRTEGIKKAFHIVRKYRGKDTPVGIVRNGAREGEEAVITDLRGVEGHYGMIDMLSIIIVGNSGTKVQHGRMITPRGYNLEATPPYPPLDKGG
ncbi:MAG: precorrin-3B C(17)-methyltransferase [Deltaproteobacteria bacterium]|nr:precorrin-3B C(17)-methyltransferase [Deltaproteobacteria bacterium]